ncbi:helix-turn-helix domain-containing protein [Micromonospora fluostatini]|uniref:helix-turn-helix domain-containing protein n=1 Tax=Micromonospora sp. JCM 30529 TaxID=3421643 RepID=UPI003D18295A
MADANKLPADLPIGRRVAYWRGRRGLTQQHLADFLGKSKSWVDKVERGVRRLDKLSVLHDIAAALRVDVDRLLTTDSSEPIPSGRMVEASNEAKVDELRAVLTRYDHTAPASPVVGLPILRRSIDYAWFALHAAAYPRLVTSLPNVIVDAQGAHAECRSAETATILSEAYQVAADLLRKLGNHHLAWLAADRGVAVSTGADDRVLSARAALVLAGTVRDSGQPRHTLEICINVAHDMAPADPLDADPEHLTVYGSLLLQAAMGAAHLDHPDTVRDLVDEAAGVAAAAAGARDVYRTHFGEPLIGVIRTAAAVALKEPDQALAEHLQTTAHPKYVTLPAAVRADHLVDVARAHLDNKDATAAGRHLVQADRIAPAEVRERPAVLDLLRKTLLATDQPGSDLRALVTAAGVDYL